jgi:hypothetical protein
LTPPALYFSPPLARRLLFTSRRRRRRPMPPRRVAIASRSSAIALYAVIGQVLPEWRYAAAARVVSDILRRHAVYSPPHAADVFLRRRLFLTSSRPAFRRRQMRICVPDVH